MSNYLIQLIRNNSNSKKRRKTSPFRVIRKIYQFFVDIPIKEGTVLHERYEVLSVIGTGSYGIVYFCNDLKSQGDRVVKQLRPSKRRNRKES